MAKLLYIEASPRKQRSSSIAVAHTFLDAYRKQHPADQIITIDLWEKELPAFDGEIINTKYAILHGQPYTKEQGEAWKSIEDIIDEFKQGDKYLFSLPMWNFNIPYKLKHYIDILVQPGYTFSYSPEKGYQGLIVDKPIALIYSRGEAYGTDTSAGELDLQTRYIETILGFIGFKNFKSIVVEPTLAGGQNEKEKALKRSNEEAQKAATQF